MIEHTFGLETHGLDDLVDELQSALRGIAPIVIVTQQANGMFLTLKCDDTASLAEASLIVGSLTRARIERAAYHPVDASVTFVERTLHKTLPSPPLSLPT